MSVGTDEGGQRVQGHKGKSKWIKEGSADRKARKNYNHGQKSRDTFAFLGRFPIHTGPTLPLTPHTMLDACILNFFRVSTLYSVQENSTKVSKRMTVLMREPRNDRKI